MERGVAITVHWEWTVTIQVTQEVGHTTGGTWKRYDLYNLCNYGPVKLKRHMCISQF